MWARARPREPPDFATPTLRGIRLLWKKGFFFKACVANLRGRRGRAGKEKFFFGGRKAKKKNSMEWDVQGNVRDPPRAVGGVGVVGHGSKKKLRPRFRSSGKFTGCLAGVERYRERSDTENRRS